MDDSCYPEAGEQSSSLSYMTDDCREKVFQSSELSDRAYVARRGIAGIAPSERQVLIQLASSI